MNFNIRHILIGVFITSVFFAVRQVWIDTTIWEYYVVAPAIIATLVSTVFCWEVENKNDAFFVSLVVAGITSAVCSIELFYAFPHMNLQPVKGTLFWSMGPIAVLILQTICATATATFFAKRSVRYKSWIIRNKHPLLVGLMFAVATTILGSQLASMKVFPYASPLQSTITFSFVGLILGAAWAHWLVGFKTVKHQ